MEVKNRNPKNGLQKKILIACCSVLVAIVLSFAGYGGYKLATDFNKINPKDKEKTPSTATTTTVITTTESVPQFWWETNSFEELSTDPELNGQDDLHNGELLLVNSSWAYCGNSEDISIVYDFRDGAPYSVKDRDVKLRLSVIYKLNDMMTDFNKATNQRKVFIESAYRTKEHQQQLYEKGDPNLVAKPGFSEHETGYAFDLAVLDNDIRLDFTGEGDYAWIPQNAHKYGFILRYARDKVGLTGIASEPWHYRYVGVTHATYMYENNLCLEEYIELIKTYKYDKEHLYIKADGKTFEVYYVPADPRAMVTQAPIYEGVSYTYSGNNTDGYIFTVDRGEGFTPPDFSNKIEETVTVSR
ncbi:hypothetical protein FACS1894132_12200 [Clostridia bacterium]|nr:hypothetical protein FACS1894132_12200 [Clostridia bacterium]